MLITGSSSFFAKITAPIMTEKRTLCWPLYKGLIFLERIVMALMSKLGSFWRSNAPTILLVGGTACLTSAVLAAFETGGKIAVEEASEPSKTGKEWFKRHKTKLIVPSLLVMAGVASVALGDSAFSNRVGKLRSLISVLEDGNDLYRKVISESKPAQKKLDEAVNEKAPILNFKPDETIVRESISGRYFSSDVETIRRAENDFNRILLNDLCGSLNAWYTLLGLEQTEFGDETGWNSDRPFELVLRPVLGPDTRPVLEIAYADAPTSRYDSIY